MLRDVINELFMMISGVFMLLAPLLENTLGNWLVFLVGVIFIMGIVVTYTVGFRFDDQFRDVFLSDKNLDSKLPMAFVSPGWLVSLRLVRAGMYARNIVLPKGTTKNWIQESWFHGYNFRKNARWFDILASYIYLLVIVVAIGFGCGSTIYQMVTGQIGNGM